MTMGMPGVTKTSHFRTDASPLFASPPEVFVRLDSVSFSIAIYFLWELSCSPLPSDLLLCCYPVLNVIGGRQLAVPHSENVDRHGLEAFAC